MASSTCPARWLRTPARRGGQEVRAQPWGWGPVAAAAARRPPHPRQHRQGVRLRRHCTPLARSARTCQQALLVVVQRAHHRRVHLLHRQVVHHLPRRRILQVQRLPHWHRRALDQLQPRRLHGGRRAHAGRQQAHRRLARGGGALLAAAGGRRRQRQAAVKRAWVAAAAQDSSMKPNRLQALMGQPQGQGSSERVARRGIAAMPLRLLLWLLLHALQRCDVLLTQRQPRRRCTPTSRQCGAPAGAAPDHMLTCRMQLANPCFRCACKCAAFAPAGDCRATSGYAASGEPPSLRDA